MINRCLTDFKELDEVLSEVHFLNLYLLDLYFIHLHQAD